MNAILSPERATRFDHRRQAATVAVASLAAVAFGMTLASLHADAAAAAMATAPIPVAAWLGTVHAFVDADLSTLRSRRLLRTRSIPWPEVRSLKAVSTSAPSTGDIRKVVLTTTGLKRFTLGAPFQGGGSDDLDFDQALDRLQRTRRAAARSGDRTRPFEPYRLTLPPHWRSQVAGTATVLAATVFLVALTVGMRAAWDAHLGRGSHGTLTVTSKDCGRSCTYYGDFVGSDGNDARPGVQLDGGSDLAVGDQVAAIDSGGTEDVFPAGGGSDWLLGTLGQAGLGAVLAFSVTKLTVNPLRRRRERWLVGS